MEELILKSLIGGGTCGAAGGAVVAWLYLKFKMDLLAKDLGSLNEQHDKDIARLTEDRKEETREIEEVNRKLDKVLEYLPVLRMLEKKLSIGGLYEHK